MARFKVPQISEFPFHITARCPNRVPFPIPLPEVWKIMEDYLYLAHHKNCLKIHSFVLMPNHFHLVAEAQTVPIGLVMNEFMTETSKELNRLSGRINQNWGGRFYRTLLTEPIYSVNCYKYVYQNPLRAGLSPRAELWKYSTLAGILGNAKVIIPLEPDNILFTPDLNLSELDWLNAHSIETDLHDFRKGLKKTQFSLPLNDNGTPHRLANSRL